jgi:hypothetical protein
MCRFDGNSSDRTERMHCSVWTIMSLNSIVDMSVMEARMPINGVVQLSTTTYKVPENS